MEYENGSVLCLCNHLTHFAIILSPGVEEVREREGNRRVRRKGEGVLVLLIHRCHQFM